MKLAFIFSRPSITQQKLTVLTTSISLRTFLVREVRYGITFEMTEILYCLNHGGYDLGTKTSLDIPADSARPALVGNG